MIAISSFVVTAIIIRINVANNPITCSSIMFQYIASYVVVAHVCMHGAAVSYSYITT